MAPRHRKHKLRKKEQHLPKEAIPSSIATAIVTWSSICKVFGSLHSMQRSGKDCPEIQCEKCPELQAQLCCASRLTCNGSFVSESVSCLNLESEVSVVPRVSVVSAWPMPQILYSFFYVGKC